MTVAMAAGVTEQNLRFIGGHLETAVEMICQRCMEPMLIPLVVDFRLGLVHSEAQALELPQGYEPLLIVEDEIAIAELVADELILALPLVALHKEVRQCEALGFTLPTGEEPPVGAEKAHPFATLSTLLKDSKIKESN